MRASVAHWRAVSCISIAVRLCACRCVLQNDAMTQAATLHDVMNTVMKENEALTLKAALASTYKVCGGVPESVRTAAFCAHRT